MYMYTDYQLYMSQVCWNGMIMTEQVGRQFARPTCKSSYERSSSCSQQAILLLATEAKPLPSQPSCVCVCVCVCVNVLYFLLSVLVPLQTGSCATVLL